LTDLNGVKPFSSLEGIVKKSEDQCFVDTSILFSATYPLDRFNEEAESAFTIISRNDVSVFTNVNVRAEFLESHRRVLIAECLIELLETNERLLNGRIIEKLKAHRTSFRRKVLEEKSAKMEVSQIRAFRFLLSSYGINGKNSWELFCRDLLQPELTPVWATAEKELGLNFISLRSDESAPYLNSVPQWENVVLLMGRYGIASADAMIINMFLCSKIPMLVTADVEMAYCVAKESGGSKKIFIPDSALSLS
jgi:predicted nucleic acid-binding protein